MHRVRVSPKKEPITFTARKKKKKKKHEKSQNEREDIIIEIIAIPVQYTVGRTILQNEYRNILVSKTSRIIAGDLVKYLGVLMTRLSPRFPRFPARPPIEMLLLLITLRLAVRGDLSTMH